jgi:hypothetical protein
LVQGLLDLALPKSKGRGDVDPEEVTEESVQETLALPYNPRTKIVFEDGSEADVTRSEAEGLGLDFDAVVRANQLQQEAIAAEEARIAAIPDYPAGAVPGISDAVVEAASTEASAIFKKQAIKSQIARTEEANRNLLGYESRDFVTDAAGNTVPLKEVQDNYIIDEVDAEKARIEAEIEQAAALANREARPILADRPAPQVLQQRQLADEAQALGAAKAELAGRPQTDLFPTQLTTAEAQEARRPAPAPAPAPKQKISQKFLKDIGIAPTDTRSRKTKPIYQRLMAKKEVPLTELNAELKAYVDNPDVKDAPTKAKINEFLGVPQNKQIELAFEGTETVTPTETTETTETAETTETVAPVKADAKPEDREALLASLEGKSIEEQIKILEGRGAPTEFTPAAVVDEQLERGETVSETTLMEESETRRDVDRAAAGIARDGGRTQNITPAQRARMLRQMRRGIEPTLEDVDPQLRQEVTKITEKEIELREQSEEKAKAEVAKKQREANLKKTEAAKDTKTKVPELSGTAQKRPKTKSRTKLKSLPEDVVKEANKRIDQGEPGSVNEIITKVPDSVIQQLRQGNLKEALELVSKSEVDPTIKRLAKQFSTMVGTTKVAIVPANPEDISGKDNYYELKNN